MGAVGVGWVGIEQGVEKYAGSLERVKEVIAGGGTAAIFSAVTRLPLRTTGRTVGLGIIVGSCISGARALQDEIRPGL